MTVRRLTAPTLAVVVVLVTSAPLRAQLPPDGPPATPIATTTVLGDTGLWFVPTGEVLPVHRWSLSAYRVNADYEQGFTDVSDWPVTLGVAVSARIEVFGAWSLVNRVDRDVRPQLFPTIVGPPIEGVGVLNEYPFVVRGWSGSRLGDLWAGAKLNFMSQYRGAPVAFAVRTLIKIPTASDAAGTGQPDFALDAVISKEIGRRFAVAGFGGFIARGDPDAFDLTNGIRWGAGVGLPTRRRLRLTTELHGEKYTSGEITPRDAAAGLPALVAEAPSTQKSPIFATLALTWVGANGVFAGAGINWNFNMKGRRDLGPFGDRTGDAAGLQVRIGYHAGVRMRSAPPSPDLHD